MAPGIHKSAGRAHQFAARGLQWGWKAKNFAERDHGGSDHSSLLDRGRREEARGDARRAKYCCARTRCCQPVKLALREILPGFPRRAPSLPPSSVTAMRG